jgi:hypothetical protein
MNIALEMGNKKDDILKTIIQKVELDKPAVNFTASVMKEVAAEACNEVVVNPALKSILKRNAIEKPALDFTKDIMIKVENLESKTIYKPIITLKAWRIIFTVLICLVVGLIVSDRPSTPPDGLTSYFVRMGDTLNTIFAQANGSLYLITIFSGGLLLLMDYFLKSKAQTRENRS